MIIAVSGTPGTGKTTLAKALAKKLNYKYHDVKRLISLNKISEGYDKQRKCNIVDLKKLGKILKAKAKKYPNSIFDSHLSHYFPADLVIITKCNLKTLETRLKKRKYSK